MEQQFNYDNKYYDEGIGGFHKASIPFIHSNFEKLKLPAHAVLDFGCGNGFHAAYLRSQSAVLHGVDFSDAIQSSRNKDHYDQLYRFDLGKETALPASHYDVLFSIEVIEHVKDYRQFIANAHKALKPGGMMFLTTTTYFWSIFVLLIVYRRKISIRTLTDFLLGWFGSEKHKTEFVMNFWDYFTGHYHGFSKKQLRKALKKQGFKIRSIRYLPIQNVVPLYTLDPPGVKLSFMQRLLIGMIRPLGKCINFICSRTRLYTPNVLIIAEK